MTINAVKHAAALLTILVASTFAASQSAYAGDELTLFDGRGRASAYVALDDELTVYLWTGKPVAYLKRNSADGFDIYGFNGKHLGWFVGGVVRDHDGSVACALKERLRSTEIEPLKSFKEFKPFKSFEEFAPFRPFFNDSWSDVPCRLFVAAGSS